MNTLGDLFEIDIAPELKRSLLKASEDDTDVINGVIITRKDGDLFAKFLGILLKFKLAYPEEIRTEDGFTYGEWIARTWRAIEDGPNGRKGDESRLFNKGDG